MVCIASAKPFVDCLVELSIHDLLSARKSASCPKAIRCCLVDWAANFEMSDYLVYFVNLPFASRQGAFYAAKAGLAGRLLMNLTSASLQGAALAAIGTDNSDIAAKAKITLSIQTLQCRLASRS